MAIATVDAALWDLKARLLDLPLVTLLGAAREAAPVYGSGGFTSYSQAQLQQQLGDRVAAGIPRVKMKVGTHPQDDPRRVSLAATLIALRTGAACTRLLRRPQLPPYGVLPRPCAHRATLF